MVWGDRKAAGQLVDADAALRARDRDDLALARGEKLSHGPFPHALS